jgi:hypothetical protein
MKHWDSGGYSQPKNRLNNIIHCSQSALGTGKVVVSLDDLFLNFVCKILFYKYKISI